MNMIQSVSILADGPQADPGAGDGKPHIEQILKGISDYIVQWGVTMKIGLLSTKYQVKRIEEPDIPEVYVLCKNNPLYYQYCPPFVTTDSIKEDLMELPKGKTPEDKYYLGFYKRDKSLVAVMDLIYGY